MSTDSRTSSSTPLTPAIVLADEAALKRAFDAEFESTLAAAKSQLGDAPNLAPRVVETAFLNLWNQRGTIANQQQLKAVLADEIRHGSARALSRRHSAGRFAGGKQTQTGQHATTSAAPADVWSRIEKGLRGPSDAVHAGAADASRHEAASHMKTMAKRPSWVVPVSIGVVALVISVAGVLYVDSLGADDAIQGAVNNAGIQPIASNIGQIGAVVLGDSSKMKMGPDTKAFLPDHFPDKIRALKIDGTAQFDVAPAKGKDALPFTVVVKKVHITATGTNFAVSGYSDDSTVAVLVKEGTVTVKVGKALTNAVANQAVIVENGAIRAATDAERAEKLGWVDGKMTITNKPLKEVVATLGRWGFDVKVPDAPLLTRPTTISVPFDSTSHPMIKENMYQVEESAKLKFGSEGTNWVLRDAPPGYKPAAPAPAAPAKAAAPAKSAPKAAAKKKK
jgi:ferric-dicitrate binding protein FerR (iron transport regulator)